MGLFIDGAERAAASGATHAVEDPSTGRPWLEVALGEADDVDRAVAAAVTAARDWGLRPAA
jgi:acyl-CoA reductase-like NAD-dependent aldehyde dehydrogenase